MSTHVPTQVSGQKGGQKGGQVSAQAPISLVKSAERLTGADDVRHISDHNGLVRNPGMALDLQQLDRIRVNKSAVERRCAGYGARRSIKKQQQAAWLLKAISLIDLTTLSGDDTQDRVKRLCSKAKKPVGTDLQRRLGIESLNLSTAAVCVYHEMLDAACSSLAGTGIHLAAVSTGFPAGLSPLP